MDATPKTGPEHIRIARELLARVGPNETEATRHVNATAAVAHAAIARVLLDAEVALEMGGLPDSADAWRAVVRPEQPAAEKGPITLTTPRA